jgi:hypothetical protein
MSIEPTIFQVVQRLEKPLCHKEIALGAFLDTEGAFDNTSFNAITTAARERELVVGGSGLCLKADWYILPSWAII